MISTESIQFLKELRLNNNRSWFDDNRYRYEKLKAEQLQLASDLLDAIVKFDPALEQLEAKDCIFRIYRDIRFSKDKTPYKTHISVILKSGGKNSQWSGYYLHIEEGQSFAGGGVWMPERLQLHKIRREIHFFHDELKTILEDRDFKKLFAGFDKDPGAQLSRPPKGYDANDPAIEYLKLKSFTVTTPLRDDLITSPDLIKVVADIFRTIYPLQRFLNRALASDENGGI
ncbi:MAG: DUF2461 domain-containing protein [Saprospiraceae bacterium]|nr:MAG: hypothetical protein UZ09_BCD002000041 [Bacteroidetes bacterium OLB9]MCO6464901.1 DUF2461 domain-containing protein [Saprospiraceae bacterium]MCZ2336863.1 DUF2461 domain-containing protein [Chitinophagales bacterium]